MAKGIFSQGAAILLSNTVSIQNIAAALGQHGIEVTGVKDPAEHWVFSGPSLIIPYRPEVNGYIQIDVVDRQWPDEMGDPAGDTILFGAWSMGFFGPFTFPGGLERAAQQSWGFPAGKEAAAEHTAFLRIRCTYSIGKMDSNTPVVPEDYDPLMELLGVTTIAEKLLELPEAICYFNPNGECLASKETIRELKERYKQTRLLPLELWSNVRMFNLPNEGWMLMDTVGMLQLDTDDHEAVFHAESYDPNEVANFLRNLSNYVYTNGPVIKDGDTVNGPGGVQWQGFLLEEGIPSPPRSVIRWYPMDEKERPAELG